MKLSCRFGFHDWDKQYPTGTSRDFSGDNAVRPFRIYKKYEKECKNCGKIKLIKIKQ